MCSVQLQRGRAAGGGVQTGLRHRRGPQLRPVLGRRAVGGRHAEMRVLAVMSHAMFYSHIISCGVSENIMYQNISINIYLVELSVLFHSIFWFYSPSQIMYKELYNSFILDNCIKIGKGGRNKGRIIKTVSSVFSETREIL